MKNILLYLSAFLLVSNSYAQSFHILDIANANVTGTMVTVQISANNTFVEDFKIKNTTGNNITYKVERIFLTPPVCSGNDIYFCAAGQCFPPDTATVQTSTQDVILANQTLPSGPNTFGIQADYIVGPTCCAEDVMYKVININNPSDFSTITIRYQCLVGVDDLSTLNNFSLAYPNPTTSKFTVKYDIKENSDNNKIVIYDLLGKVVKEKVLINKQGVVEVDVTNINSGTYIYSLVVDDNAIISRKLVISSK